MSELMVRERTEAKKKGVYAGAAWGGTVLLGVVAGAGPLLLIPAAAGAGYLTWKWFLYRAKHGIRF